MAKPKQDHGLFLRGKRYYCRVYVPGRGIKVFSLKPDGQAKATGDIAVARILANRIRAKVKEQASGMTSTDLAGLVREFARVGVLNGQDRQAQFGAMVVQRFIEASGVRVPSDITSSKVTSYLTGLVEGKRTPATVRNHRSALSRFCTFLAKRGLAAGNAALETDSPAVEDSQVIFLDADETGKALAVAKEHGIEAEVATALFTGLRRSELRRLEWSSVDLERRTLLVPKSKSGHKRVVPLSDKALETFRAQHVKTGSGRYVFPGPDGEQRSDWWWSDAPRVLRDHPDLPTFRRRTGKSVGRCWHALRHTFASTLVQAGVSVYKVAEWLGHSDVRTTQLYAHLAPKYDAEIEKLHQTKPGDVHP